MHIYNSKIYGNVYSVLVQRLVLQKAGQRTTFIIIYVQVKHSFVEGMYTGAGRLCLSKGPSGNLPVLPVMQTDFTL